MQPRESKTKCNHLTTKGLHLLCQLALNEEAWMKKGYMLQALALIGYNDRSEGKELFSVKKLGGVT